MTFLASDQAKSHASLFEGPTDIDFRRILWYINSIPYWGIPGNLKTLALGEGLALVIPKGESIMPMKKPVRLLGMVFQID